MKKECITEKKYKKICINLLERFAEYCKKHGLTYYLAYGSLLGAVRHNGLIPWDDDIDVQMPRKDYNKLIDLLKNNKSEFNLFYFNNPKEYGHYFAKISDVTTELKFHYMKDIQGLGVFIDVFPMDIVKLSSNNQRKLERKVKKVLTLLELSNMKKCWPANGIIKNITKNAIFFYVKLRGTRYWYKKYEKLIFNAQQKNESKKEQYIFAWSILEKDDFGNGVLLKYEKNRYSCPCNFDKYLKKEYGNYMEFPPEKDRKSVHDFDAYFKN